jgi:lipopolysaccharide assembly protein A
MRFFYRLLFVLLLAVVVVFAVQNYENVSVAFLNQGLNAPMAVFIAISYLLGMLSGWLVFGLVRRSLR